MIRRPPRSTLSSSSAASDVYKRQKRYHAEGLPGLISKKRGQVSNRRLDEATKATAIELIGTHYRDFGPTLVVEKLTEKHKLKLSVETVRQLMIAADYWHPKKGSKICIH